MGQIVDGVNLKEQGKRLKRFRDEYKTIIKYGSYELLPPDAEPEEITQDDLRNLTGLSRATISKWENGHSWIKPRYYKDLYEKWGLCEEWLKYETGPMLDLSHINRVRKEMGLDKIKNADTKTYIDIDDIEINNEIAGKETGDFPAGYWDKIIPMDVSTLRVKDEGGVLRSELIVLGKIGIPAIDHNPNLLCCWYDGHEMKDIRDGSIVIVDKSKREPITGELYLYKYFSNESKINQFSIHVRRLTLPRAGGGYILERTDGFRERRVKDMDILWTMTMGRVMFIYARQTLARDMVLDNFKLMYPDDQEMKAVGSG